MSGFDTFASVTQAPPDKILGLKEEFVADKKTNKIDLSIGVYRSDSGTTPFLDVVLEARKEILGAGVASGEDPSARVEYIPILGLSDFCSASQKMIFGDESEAVKEGRIVTLQSVGGTGALRVGADFLKRYYPQSTVYISDPTWPNHRSVFQKAGFEVAVYPYFDKAKKGICFDKMMEVLSAAAPKSIILLQAACHNPTGFDLSDAQWAEVLTVCQKSDLIPFFDFAYQGFDRGITEDGRALRAFLKAGVSFLVAGSFSKNFGLYNSRIGTLSIVTKSCDQAKLVASQVKVDVRTNYSSPPRDPAVLVASILKDPVKRARWEEEVAGMRGRIARMRDALRVALESRGLGDQFQHLKNQSGLFFFSGLTAEQMGRLKKDHGIYGVDDGRICIAAITPDAVEQIADAIAAVCR